MRKLGILLVLLLVFPLILGSISCASNGNEIQLAGSYDICPALYPSNSSSTQGEYVKISSWTNHPVDLEGCKLVVCKYTFFGTILAIEQPVFLSITFPSHTLKPGDSVRVYTNEYHPEFGGYNFEHTSPLWHEDSMYGAIIYTAQGEQGLSVMSFSMPIEE